MIVGQPKGRSPDRVTGCVLIDSLEVLAACASPRCLAAAVTASAATPHARGHNLGRQLVAARTPPSDDEYDRIEYAGLPVNVRKPMPDSVFAVATTGGEASQ
jgi:hypothetical protein